MSVTVATQAELDKALADKVDVIYIESPSGVWLRLDDSGSSHVVAWGSSHVVARGSSHVVAGDSSHVEAWGSSHVVAGDSSHVEAWGSSHVVAWGSSHVVAWGSSHVEARGSSHVEAWGSSHVVAGDSSHVEARGSSHVVAWGSSHVEARGSSHVVAWDSSHVVAGKYGAVHLHSQKVTLDAQGAVIDCTGINLRDVTQWADWTGARITDGSMVLFKAVDDELRSGRGFAYPLGETVRADDYADDHKCGEGLHLSPSVGLAIGYHLKAARFLACRVNVGDVSPIDVSKVKVRACEVLYEVDRYGQRLQTEVSS